MRPGERIGDYTVVSKIGEGGMSIVYLAEHASDGTRVVVKELKEQHRFNTQVVERFRREATILQELPHEHLARVFDVLSHEGKEYIIQEYLAGGSLADLLREGTPYKEEQAIRWCCDALQAMDYAHQKGVVHRDLKPSNLMLDDQGRIRVIDFGIARAFGQDRITRTHDGSIGTVEYMSPEQILTPHLIDHQTDVYSMGIVLYELLSGAVPFEGPTPFAVQQQITKQPPPPLKQLGRSVAPLRPDGGGVHPQLARIVLHAIEKRPDRRFGGCAEFAQELNRYVTGQRGPDPVWAWRPLAIAGAALVLLIVALLTWRLSATVPQTEITPTADPNPNGNLTPATQQVVDTGPAVPQAIDPDPNSTSVAPPEPSEPNGVPAGPPGVDTRGETQSSSAEQRRLEVERRARAEREEQLRQLEAERQQEAERQAEAERQRVERERADAERQRTEAERRRAETDRLAQVQKQQELERQQREAEQKRLDEQRRQEEQRGRDAERQRVQAQQTQQEALERQRRLEQQQAASRFFASVMGTWTRTEEDRSGQPRTRTKEVLNIGEGCSGVLTRTVTTLEKGFSAWREVDTQTSRFMIRCDASGRVSGDLIGQLSPRGGTLVFGDNTFVRSR